MPTGAGGLNTPIGMAFGGDGFLYATSGGTNQVLKYDATTGAFVGVFANSLPGGLTSPAFITIIPTPGTAVILAIGFLGTRRRRAYAGRCLKSRMKWTRNSVGERAGKCSLFLLERKSSRLCEPGTRAALDFLLKNVYFTNWL